MMRFRARQVPSWLLLFVAAGCARGNGTDSSQSSQSTPASSAVVVAPEETPGGTAWTVGQRQAFGLKLTSALAFGPQAKTLDFTVTGTLQVAPAAVHGNVASLFIIVEKASIESRVPDPEGQLQLLAKQLSQSGCYLEMAGGQVTELRFTPDLPPMVVNLYRTIASALQVTVPAKKRDHFEVKERDGTGEYTAAYEGTGERAWSKHKLSYSKLLGKMGGTSPSTFQGILPEVASSSGDLQLAEDGRLVRVRALDEIKIRGAQLPVNSTSAVELNEISVTPGAPVQDWKALGKPLTRLGADEPYVQSANREAMSSAMDDARINGQSFEAVVDSLRATAVSRDAADRPKAAKASDASELDQQETSQFVALAAMFRRRESDIGKAVKRMRADPVMADTLVDALSSSGSPAAHQALADMLTAKGIDPKLRQRALGGLALTRRPSPVAVDALKGELARQPFNASALFGLGSFARYYGDNGDTAQEKALGELLLQRLRSTDDMVPRIVVTLRAIANSGYLGALDEVTRRLDDRRSEVRVAAIRAVQHMRGSQIDQLLANTITKDKDTDVSVSALASARARKPTDVLVGALTSAAQTATEPKVRYGSVQLLTQWSKERPDVRPVIQRVAANDAEESIRTLAKSAL